MEQHNKNTTKTTTGHSRTLDLPQVRTWNNATKKLPKLPHDIAGHWTSNKYAQQWNNATKKLPKLPHDTAGHYTSHKYTQQWNNATKKLPKLPHDIHQQVRTTMEQRNKETTKTTTGHSRTLEQLNNATKKLPKLPQDMAGH